MDPEAAAAQTNLNDETNDAALLCDPNGPTEAEQEADEACQVLIHPNADLGADDEEVCGVCLEAPSPGNFVELWCCGNTLCVTDAQQLGKCPFCREEPLVWNITK